MSEESSKFIKEIFNNCTICTITYIAFQKRITSLKEFKEHKCPECETTYNIIMERIKKKFKEM